MSVFYIKTSSYIKAYIESKYASMPVLFPQYTRIGDIIRNCIFDNSDRIRIGNSCCELAMSDTGSHHALFRHADIPTTEEIPLMFPITLPDESIRGGKFVKTGPTWQLTRKGTSRLREELKYEFWCDMMISSRDAQITHMRTGTNSSFNHSAFVEDWICHHGISLDDFDTVLRNYKREMSRILSHYRRN